MQPLHDSEGRIQLPLPSHVVDLKPQMYPCIPVKHKQTGADMVVRESDYDPAIHDRSAKPEVSRKVLARRVRYDRDQLASMTIEALKELPEWDAVEDQAGARTKDQIIDAILSVP
jgi:hypothetical protein